ncbi:hypothetical protein BCR24_09360 [Enterococcus ureilyticus]|uniref:HTH cro/C1-type domain-containing protein n=1 Tax=Enterococcus ureilyticus TaxID=1131292 RepID=A0A1E5H5C1_9ENTE|nr:Rgg/GadR/MutR family transcriptional regulator [Enterococcus ureilyticus]MBM7689085.1 transcriptional regulator with XRE-family HTH domain [Enterococcus ureilyticus]MBO0446206.1 hypothetical protein [Enterococcus ureilyticus]OEG20121.1 hypothetical protein BCR24_09360 [Enterococcus ureilyticus]
MNVEEALYFFRKNKNLKQKDVLTYTDTSVYSKIETGKKILRFSELTDILERFSIPLEEFSEYLEDSIEQKKFRKLFKQCGNNPTDESSKYELLSYYNQLSFSKEMHLREMANFIGIKTLFSNYWKEISPVSQEELNQIYDLLIKKEYFFQYDYAVLSNTIFLFNDKQIKSLAKKVLPVKDIEIRNVETTEFIKNMINNLITTLLRKKEYEESRYYLKLAITKEGSLTFDYKLVIQYLDNLTSYLITGDDRYKENIVDYIHLLTKLGEQHFAKSIEREVYSIISESKDIPIFIQADL